MKKISFYTLFLTAMFCLTIPALAGDPVCADGQIPIGGICQAPPPVQSEPVSSKEDLFGWSEWLIYFQSFSL